MATRFWKFANPHHFGKLVAASTPALWSLSFLFLVTGLLWGFLFTPDDFRQGSTVKIIFVHVPSALMAINCWLMMLVSSIIWMVRRHRISILAAKAAAPVGLSFTLVALISGGLWGQPMWGTFWAWDPRLTSFLILFLHYITYQLIWIYIADKESAANISSLVCLVGSVFALLSRYAVNLWNQGLHQGATLSLDQETNIHNSYYIPLVICILGFVLLFITLVLVRTRTEIIHNQIELMEKQRRKQNA
ncbi:MAG: heme ABC transporter permease [Paracoccaceae bacterium]|nr:heme ABC transporter permease [Paracoccaceae bacterium]MDE2674848.1 heme ABC transporter permease [Paracoccaceae bacterium]MDE2738825.1 heme ABC transporter permease [Paracoccaceae bacterium]